MDREVFEKFLAIWREANNDPTATFKNGDDSIYSVFRQGAKFRANLKANMRRNREYARQYKQEHDVE